ncbi:MAG: phosphoribosyltransferase family protein [Bacteroidetes bacterium]|nr:phosphoribosyltransferase family protein [Bacteroidota bacterium]MDA0902835.1 phosphoribosyltransferase family protein [Bacteroidota bacterium]MDA1242012.1 phosphoribosyltransferase family protein [Bacteroidota bacterium]
MTIHRDLVLTHDHIVKKLDRMAREILEVHFRESRLVLVGIEGQGVRVCEALTRRLRTLSTLEILEAELHINKDMPMSEEVICNIPMTALNDAIVIVVDDVLNSGKTLIHAVRHVLLGNPREVHTAVLVDRKHRAFPVRADYCGLTLSTHLNEHISVDLSDTDNASVHIERPGAP